MTWENLRIAEANGIYLDGYRFDTLDYFLGHGRAHQFGGGSMKDEIKMIPIDRIRILNPRHRDRKKFEVIVQSIKNLGLKKPIQVSLRSAQEAAGLGTIWFAARVESKRLLRSDIKKSRRWLSKSQKRNACFEAWLKTWLADTRHPWH
jgi:hypothetical protein